MEAQIDKGLSSQQAKKLQKQYGKNILPEKKQSLWIRLFHLYWGPIPWMIEMAAFLSFLLQRWPDFIMIMALLIINSTL